jgi:hypothetical protein
MCRCRWALKQCADFTQPIQMVECMWRLVGCFTSSSGLCGLLDRAAWRHLLCLADAYDGCAKPAVAALAVS